MKYIKKQMGEVCERGDIYVDEHFSQLSLWLGISTNRRSITLQDNKIVFEFYYPQDEIIKVGERWRGFYKKGRETAL